MATDSSSGAEPLFHIALARDWAAAQEAGDYRVSTLGRTLEDEGFLHASYAHQWRDVRDAFYGDVAEPLVLLEIDPTRLGSPVVVERPVGADDSADAFPHVYGPLPVSAVTAARPI